MNHESFHIRMILRNDGGTAALPFHSHVAMIKTQGKPSKALLAAAKRAAAVRDAARFGVRTSDTDVDFPSVMERMRELRAHIAPHDSAKRFRELGVDVFLGEGRFKDGQTVEVDGTDLKFAKAVIATGGRAIVLPIPGLESAGVRFDKSRGVEVDEHLRTSNPKIFAVGDVAMNYKFTHMAGATARMVLQNALFKGRKKHTDLLVPWCTFTQPEIAHVGLYEEAAKARHGEALMTCKQDFADLDQCILEGYTEGFIKVHAVKGGIVGATIVGEHAGDLISEITVAMNGGVKLGALANTIHPYPTTAEAIQRVGDAYNRTRFTPFLQKLFKAWLKWSR